MKKDSLDDCHSHSESQPRRFFQSSAVWDPSLKAVVIQDGDILGASGPNGRGRIGSLMAHGGLGADGLISMDVDMDSNVRDDWKEGDGFVSIEA